MGAAGLTAHAVARMRDASASADATTSALNVTSVTAQTRQVVGRLRDARDHGRWTPDPQYCIAADALFDQDPDAAAMLLSGTHGPTEVTFGEVQAAVLDIASALREAGVAPGDRVAMYLDPSRVAAEVVFAVLTLGAVLVPVPRLLGGGAVAQRVSEAGVRLLVTDGAGRDRVADHVAALDGVRVITTDQSSADDLSGLPRATEPVEVHRPTADHPALLIFTSGTGGFPKGIVHANRVLLGHAGVDFAFEMFEPSDVYYGTADWGWVGGLMLGLLVPWAFGVPVVAFRQQKFDPAATLAILDWYEVTVAFLPPSVLRMLEAHGKPPRRRLRAVVTGGEPAGVREMTWARRNLSAAVNKAYGQTEANALIGDSSTLGSVDDSTMGAPYPGHDIRLIDEAGAEVAAGEAGEIAVALPDPVAMLGVWDSEIGAPVLPDQRWHRTGDMARVAHGNRLEYLGRADDVIKSRGYRIGPGEIEEALKAHPAVTDAAAVGFPDPDIGQYIKAFVQLREPTPGHLDEELTSELTELVVSCVGPHARPRVIEAITQLPRTETGKLLRRDLATQA